MPDLKSNGILLAVGMALGAGGMAVSGGEAPTPAPAALVAPQPRVWRCTDLTPVQWSAPCDGDGDGVSCGLWQCAEPGATPAPGVCVETPGARPSEERCDGADNDCDGRIDDGLNLGLPCRLPSGTDPVAPRDGHIACLPDGTAGCVPRGARAQP